jgi:hypothetical protein
MAMMMGKLYAALRAADVPDSDAISAAEEVASYETRLAGVEARLTLVQWMLGFNLALTTTLVGLVVTILLRLPLPH